MKLMQFLTVLTVVGFAGLASAEASQPLVDVNWVKSNIGKSNVVFLDVTSNPMAFANGHIPGAIFTHYKKDKWRVGGKKNGKKIAGLLPSTPHLEKLLGKLGIENTSHVVIIPQGARAADMGTATRVYWTLKLLGHDSVSILNGGMISYLKNKKNPLEKGMTKPMAKVYKAKAFRDELIATDEEVKEALKNSTTLIDSRPTHQHLGFNKSGAVQSYGTIPGSVNVPGEWSTVNGSGKLRSKASIDKLYAYTKAPSTGKSITYCNTGHWASLGWFINYEMMGNKQTALYDGSLTQWTTDPKNPMKRINSLD